ncbi:MAG TPA: ImmA/IrrE family metallo-endopeptidase, partial [Candidatus Limnocylindrales bacterium]|nr:ImmA/IrrE family metallo-endopeptidase [Candidatus Limnocylindrales bacterium]
MAVRVDLNISLDGFATTTDQTRESPFGPDWSRLVEAYIATHTFRARVLHDTSGEGTTGVDDEYAQAYFAEVGAEIMGAGMFGLHAAADDPDWRGWWGDEPPFRVPFGTRRFDAVSQWADHMPPVFLLNDVATPDRVRFSLAHEIGHVVMHSMPTPDMEREAHRFAAEFLMPAREIRGDLVNLDMAKAAALKQHWKVSMAALIYRARDLDVIPDWRAKAMFVELGRRGWRINEPGDVRIEEPSLAREIVDA